jgi:Ni/Co efflux regulator RcnB
VLDRRDYRRYRLAEPRRDQRWVRVDNQFLLINAVSGLIVGLAAAR